MSPTLRCSSPICGDSAPWGSSSAIFASAGLGYHVLRIDGYLRTKHAVPNGKYIDSRPFSVAGHTWAVMYYPHGYRESSVDFISLFLVLKSQIDEDVKVQFSLSFIDDVEKHALSYVRTVTANRFSAQSCVCGRVEFIKREDLERSGRLKDDCFTIRCDMIVTGELRAEDTVTSSIVVPPPDWPQHFRALLLSENGADVKFRVGDEVFTAHRCVLAARSPVFCAELFGTMKEADTSVPCIRIDDIVPQVFKCCACCISFTPTQLPEMDGADDSSPAMEQHLLEAADRYGMQRLKVICEDRLSRYIDVNTVATTLALAEQQHCQGLKKVCFDFLLKSSEMLDAVKETNGFQHLVKKLPLCCFRVDVQACGPLMHGRE